MPGHRLSQAPDVDVVTSNDIAPEIDPLCNKVDARSPGRDIRLTPRFALISRELS